MISCCVKFIAGKALQSAINLIDPRARVAAKSPIEVDLVKGKKFLYCACGRSSKQPFCDYSHIKFTGMLPKSFKAESSGKAWLCRCKQTQNPPYCDGSHKQL